MPADSVAAVDPRYMGLPIHESKLVSEGEILVVRDEGRAYAAVNTLWSLRHGGAWPLLSRYSRGMLELARDRRRYPRPTGEVRLKAAFDRPHFWDKALLDDEPLTGMRGWMGRGERGTGRRIASVYTWAATLPGRGRCLAITVNGNHDVGIAVEPEGFVPDCRTCHLPGRPYDTALEAAEVLHRHTEQPR